MTTRDRDHTEHTGRLHIGKMSGGGEQPNVRITLQDQASRTQQVIIQMTVEDFALALFAGELPCTYELGRPDLAGWRREHVTVVVPGDWGPNDADSLNAAAFQAAEHQGYPQEDGWERFDNGSPGTGSAREYGFNFHQRKADGFHTLWERWVAPEPVEVEL